MRFQHGTVTVSCILPAYNEAERIGVVLAVCAAHPLIDEVVVVDDGSSDGTSAVVRAFPTVRLVMHPRNAGKTAAVLSGIQASSGKFIVLLDADLAGLAPDDITRLIEPVVRGEADICLSLRGNTMAHWKLLGIDFITGERVFPRTLIQEHISELARAPGFTLEPLLNAYIIEQQRRVKIVSWPNVESPYKYKKYGIAQGMQGDAHLVSDIFSVLPLHEMLLQIWKLLKLRV